ncbi:MAG: HPr family phosphocarrier protein [Anaerolineae bacterium]|nr:HPr family phosphocarrier protein [Anaerolineae bacterium]
MEQLRIRVINEVGLHARPAALFVNAAKSSKSKVRVRNVTTDSKWVDAKSILGVLTLGVEKDHEIELTAEGPDEVETLTRIGDLIRNDFRE